MIGFRPLKAEDVEVRVNQCTERGVSLLLYKTARTDMALLDEAVGPESWQCDYKEVGGKLYCGIGCRFEGEWVWKWDVGTPSNMEADKGHASDAFKRAGFKWGIGRELYTAPRIWVGADACTVRDGRNGKKQCYDDFRVAEMEVADGAIVKLTVCNMSRRGEVVYGNGAQGRKEQRPPAKQPEEPPQQQDALAAARARLSRAIDGYGERNPTVDAAAIKARVKERQGYGEHKDDPAWFEALAAEFEAA